MRTKSFLLGFICIVATTILLFIFGDHRQNIQNLVSETHRQLKDNIQNIKDHLDGKLEEKNLKTDEKYLNLLGFGDGARFYPGNSWKNTSLPVIISYVKEGNIEQAVGLVRNIAHSLPSHILLIYNLGLSKYDLQLLQGHCNGSHCTIIEFDLSQFPSHVTDSKIHAFRPLVIQDGLRRAGAVLFLESNQRVVSAVRLSSVISRVAASGLLGWEDGLGRAVTSLTHPHMFTYFKATKDSFMFVPMVSASPLLVFNTHSIHTGVMLPWVQCALTHDCILPIGAQSGGCRFDKKPYYRYSGCHSYDVSALNIVLGLHFQFNYEIYSRKVGQSFQLFKEMRSEDAARELALLLRDNTTDSPSPRPTP